MKKEGEPRPQWSALPRQVSDWWDRWPSGRPSPTRKTPFISYNSFFVGHAITNPENTVYSIKRFMGRLYNEVGEELKMVPYKVVQSGDHVAVLAQGKEHTPPQISALILQKLKKAAEDYLGEKVTEAVITVP